MAILALTVWFGLVLQFYISIEKYLSQGRTVGGAIVQLWSYFTIQNNFLVALCLTLLLLSPSSKWGRFFSKNTTLTAMCVYITIVCLVYQLILRGQHTQYGLFKLADEIFHSVSPVLFVLFWLIFVSKTLIPWGKCFTWLIYPLIYLVYILIRGAVSGLYPYSFIDVSQIGYPQTFINSAVLLFVFLGMGAAFITISRMQAKSKKT